MLKIHIGTVKWKVILGYRKLKNTTNWIHTFHFCSAATDKKTRNPDHDWSGRVSYNRTVCFTNEALCVCMLLSYRTAGPASPAQGSWNMVTFLRKEKETFCKVQTPFAWWKMCSNCHNHALKINVCQSLKLLLLDIFWFFDKWKWWRRRKWWREVGCTSL